MKRLLLPLLAAFALPTAVNAETNNLDGYSYIQPQAEVKGDTDYQPYSVERFQNNQVEKQSVEQGQKRPSGWRQKPTSIKRNPGGLKRRAR